MNIREITVTRHINLPDGQSTDILITGHMSEPGLSIESAKVVLLNVLNTGLVNILRNDIVKPLEEKFQKPHHKEKLKVV